MANIVALSIQRLKAKHSLINMHIYLSETLKIILIIVTAVAIVLIVGCLLYFPLKRRWMMKHYGEAYYRTVKNIAHDEDYYLINKFVYHTGDKKRAMIDHIIFADKYIYLISSYYFDGDITGDKGDQSLILYPKNGKKIYIKNPLVQSKYLLDQLNYSTDLDKSLFICVALINDSVNLTLNGDGKQFYIIQNKKLKALIKAIESRDIDPMDDELLKKCVDAFSVNNRRID